MVREFCVKAQRVARISAPGWQRRKPFSRPIPKPSAPSSASADRVSGCNLFAVLSPQGLALFDVWHGLEKNRKNPGSWWRLSACAHC
jgi:hypothetical protein